ncbi:hypothetical protein COO91_04345 [Nostoc flagelliforme CCNUN1]|uniref:Uncharacterized protein n=1 Tax=Nostoc flagelliforme CCNUN1 TaxID=2038116 RepID=A0A2K8SUA5_9NOSO|nr:hypothetical protein COO91_04345 [Nostoc flagelliforme CCNUN1]
MINFNPAQELLRSHQNLSNRIQESGVRIQHEFCTTGG